MEAFAVDDWDDLEVLFFGRDPKEYMSEELLGYGTYAGVPQARPDILHEEEQRRRAALKRKEEETRVRRQKQLEEYKAKEKSISRKRLKETFAVSLGIVVVAIMFGMILLRQAQITQKNFANNDLEQQIVDMKQETSQIEEELILNADYDQIRVDAMENLGMQDPGSKQIITVELPGEDQLVTAGSGKVSSSSASIAKAKEDLAQYYLNMN